MARFVSVEKLSKKERRKRALAARGTWGSINPVTRKPENPKAYRRSKMKRLKPDRECDL
ncbi:hypothetical protein [Papillibacter cinnamivorans]|uniref:Uncharacterized protein n=1 Tax=Papillibacter cinnamivorans DSM 12816 TaxID=1122930 RepID=A0A1W2D287_9FIRM|nr:hypothetical protein [Papillibacter cinnamivorans]SMC91178.1 hypothetical protein SAMN02745168_0309 [Papillibacter cinnamivorans DSM 12816]